MVGYSVGDEERMRGQGSVGGGPGRELRSESGEAVDLGKDAFDWMVLGDDPLRRKANEGAIGV